AAEARQGADCAKARVVQVGVVRGADVLVINVIDSITTAEHGLTGAGENPGHETVLAKVWRPSHADVRAKIVFVRLEEVARFAGISADNLELTVRVRQRLEEALSRFNLRLKVDHVRIGQRGVELIAQT